MNVQAASAGRVAGWDLLRGLCALTVAAYHLLYWLELAELPALATYGVYMFFVLSGASLAYTYGADQLRGLSGMGSFLLTRWLRLAPLYLVLCVLFLCMLAARNGAWTSLIPQRLALNATFAFGLHDPTIWALLIGGWSLGIEFVYYLLFPLFVRLAATHTLATLVFAALTGLQFTWIAQTLGTHGWQDGATAYHQVPAFVAYFFGGCVIGRLALSQPRDWPFGAGVAAWCGMGALLALLMPERAGDELMGLRGAVLFAACFAVVYASGRVAVRGRLATLSSVLGDITYGTYLLHPMLFWTLAWFVVDPLQLPAPERVLVLATVLAATCYLAYASERWFERPLRRLARPRRPRAVQSDAASSSS